MQRAHTLCFSIPF